MIALHNVTKTVGRGNRRSLVLDEINWDIPNKSRIVILGHRGSGKTTLLEMISGAQTPTSGWVQRRAVISAKPGLTRHASKLTSPRTLISHLSVLYRADPLELGRFVEEFGGVHDVMDIAVSRLTGPIRQKIDLGLFYGLPCDFYLFDNKVHLGPPELRDRAQAVYQQRCEQAGMILSTSVPRYARDFGGTGAVLHRGKVFVFDQLEDAISAFENLPVDDPVPARGPSLKVPSPANDIDIDL